MLGGEECPKTKRRKPIDRNPEEEKQTKSVWEVRRHTHTPHHTQTETETERQRQRKHEYDGDSSGDPQRHGQARESENIKKTKKGTGAQ